MIDFTKAFTFIITYMFFMVLFGLLLSLPVMWLWNYDLVPAVSVIKPISWTQAWGIMILCGLLFKGTNSTSGD